MFSQGIGILLYSNGDSYDGEWIDGERNGKGKFISNSEKYLGYWKDGKKEGTGTLTDDNGNKYGVIGKMI